MRYAGRGEVFEGLAVWKEEGYRDLQGSHPVISLSFARVKDTEFPKVRKTICQIIREIYNEYDFLLGSGCLNEDEEGYFRSVSVEMEAHVAAGALRVLSGYLMRYHGKKVIIPNVNHGKSPLNIFDTVLEPQMLFAVVNSF